MDSNYFQEYKKGGLDYIKLFDYEFERIDLEIRNSEKEELAKLEEGINDYLNGTNGRDKKTEYVKSMQCFIKDPKKASKIADLFCRIEIKNGFDYNEPGVYVWTIKLKDVTKSKVVYVGETSTILDRIEDGYGKITPRNVFKGGQSTNCKMNHVVKEHNDKRNLVRVYYMECSTRNKTKKIEKELIENLNKEEVPLFNYQHNEHKIDDILLLK